MGGDKGLSGIAEESVRTFASERSWYNAPMRFPLALVLGLAAGSFVSVVM